MSKRFKWRIIGPDTVVIFRGVWGTAHKNDSDDFDVRHGIYLALLRAMRSKMLKRPGDREGGAVDEAIERLAYDGRVKDWQRLTASFISFCAYERGRGEYERLIPNGLTATITDDNSGIIISGVLDISVKKPKSDDVIESAFVYLHRIELDELVDVGHILTGDPGPQIDKAEELRDQWQTEVGQLWRIPSKTANGEHRIICGDCTDAAMVGRVMGGEMAEMVFTDPPYGVAVGDKNKWLNSIARSNRVEQNLQNDTLDEGSLVIMLESAFDNAVEYQTAGGAWYVAAPAGPLHHLFGGVLKERGIWRQTIQWVKNNATFSPLGVCYHWQCEPIFFGWLPNAAHRCYGDRTETTAWMIDRPIASPEHPTMKPVELVEIAVRKSSQKNEIVFDPFLGSGTTLIAAERLGRLGRGIELSPAYVAVALQRLADMGLEPELVEA